MSAKKRWIMVVLFAAAMAWVESAVVVYLRTLVDRLEPYQVNPLPIAPRLGEAEIVRELATLIMLFAVGWLAGNTKRARLGYSLIAFGVWDIFYYVFLKIIVGWPQSILDWDILFLLPLPWWGPVIAPVTIAAMMIIFGTLATQFDQSIWPSRRAWFFNWSGGALALLVFMSDAIHAVDGGIEAIRNVLPVWFNWPVFIIALVLMAVPIIDMIRQIWKARKRGSAVSVAAGEMHFGLQTFLWLLLYKIVSRDT
ncbi:hypothetical protein L0337_13075 [candidate division KSB1 bacterium]|nr:hypothetical protein [candidate division KSB1 bacterium]